MELNLGKDYYYFKPHAPYVERWYNPKTSTPLIVVMHRHGMRYILLKPDEGIINQQVIDPTGKCTLMTPMQLEIFIQEIKRKMALNPDDTTLSEALSELGLAIT